MTTQLKLTETQRQVLEHATGITNGAITWFPGNVKGGARQKVLNGLSSRALITHTDNDWLVTTDGYKATGRVQPVVGATARQVRVESDRPVPRTREHSKQAAVIQMLQRPEGATISQICAVTGWQAHTVRGTFAGAFKRKLSLNLVSEKVPDGDRVYRIV